MNNERTEHALQLQLRKKQSNLAAVGLGVIAFGVWSVIKTVLYTALDAGGALSVHAGEPYFLLAFWILLGGALAVDLALRVHFGRCAIAEGRGEKRKPGYIVLALLMTVFSFAGLAAGLFMMDASADIESALVSLLVEISSDVLLLDMSVSAVQVHRLTRTITEAEN